MIKNTLAVVGNSADLAVDIRISRELQQFRSPDRAKAFIVYQNEGNLSDCVVNLASFLRFHCGVDCDVTSYHLDEDVTNWNEFIKDRIEKAEYILLVCTKALSEKLVGQCHSRVEMTTSTGPYILSSTLNSLLENNSKTLPIILKESNRKYIPTHLQSMTFYTISLGTIPNAECITKQAVKEMLDMPKYNGLRSLVARLLHWPEVVALAVTTHKSQDPGIAVSKRHFELPDDEKGSVEVDKLSKHTKRFYKRTKYKLSDGTWPPEQPKEFTPVVLMHHQGQRSSKDAIALTKAVYSINLNDINAVFATGNQYIINQHPNLKCHSSCLQMLLNTSKITKDIKEILAPLEENEDPQLLLVEGAPGIGKTILLKEIAFKWSENRLLTKFKLVLLLCLRDQRVQKLSSADQLFSNYLEYATNRGDTAKLCYDHFSENGGEDILFLLDGYDELPLIMKEDSLIASIINHQLFPDCSLIISSRPHASVHLRQQATCRVDVLGFTEDEKKCYIQSSLKGRPQAITELSQYLNSHLSLNNLCSVPFNLAALLFLYKNGIPLPKNSTELYNLFICLTICCHMAKHGKTDRKDITDLAGLPEPYHRIIQQLSVLSLKALDIKWLVFTSEEIKQFCPDIEMIPEAINGFGILQAVEHFGITCTKRTFNFTHFSIQEYLAAYCVAHLLPEEELQILQKYFWSGTHSNMFSMYVAMTQGQHSAFKCFLSDGNSTVKIADKFLGSQLSCLRLFKCFYEAGDEEMYSCIDKEKVFRDKIISLRFHELSPSDIECLGLFLTSSTTKQWQALNLTSCSLRDYEIRTLHQGIAGISPINIASVDLPANFITSSSDSCISDLVINCSVTSLGASGNKTLGETMQFYTMISHPQSVLEQLWVAGNRLTTVSAIFIFRALREPNQLKTLIISDNLIDDDICDEVITTLQINKTLKRLLMSNNPIGSDCAHKMINSLFCNDVLSLLWLPAYSDEVIGAMKVKQEEINENRQKNEHQFQAEALELRFVNI